MVSGEASVFSDSVVKNEIVKGNGKIKINTIGSIILTVETR